MGNVGASSKPIQDPKFDLPMDLQSSESKQKKPLENPGTMEELHKRCKGKLCATWIHRLLSGFFTQFDNRSIPTSNDDVFIAPSRRDASVLRGS